MLLPKRHASDESYRYGFQGQEKDDELKGEGNNYDFGSRNIYDPRLGRFVSVDPKFRSYESFSPYAFAANNPIIFIDKDGEFPWLAKILAEAVYWIRQKITSERAATKFVNRHKITGEHRKIVMHRIGMYDGAFSQIDFKQMAHDELTDFAESLGEWWDSDPFENNTYGQKSPEDIQRSILGPVGISRMRQIKQVIQLIENWDEFSDYNKGQIEGVLYAATAEFLVTSGLVSIKSVRNLFKGFKFKLRFRKKPCGCFISGTKVYTEEGYKNIEDVKKGDLVWAYDDKTGDLALKVVTSTFKLEFTQIYKIYVGNEIIEATHEHPFFVGGKWLKVDELKVGDKLQLYDGTTLSIDKIKLVEGSFKVFNFEVEDYHTYYVSKNNILVHNGSDCKFGIKTSILDRVKARVIGLKDRFTGNIRIKAFGSRTKGTHRPNSDLDIVVMVDDKDSFGTLRVQKILQSIKDDFKKDTGVDLDINIIEYDELPYMKFKNAELIDF